MYGKAQKCLHGTVREKYVIELNSQCFRRIHSKYIYHPQKYGHHDAVNNKSLVCILLVIVCTPLSSKAPGDSCIVGVDTPPMHPLRTLLIPPTASWPQCIHMFVVHSTLYSVHALIIVQQSVCHLVFVSNCMKVCIYLSNVTT